MNGIPCLIDKNSNVYADITNCLALIEKHSERDYELICSRTVYFDWLTASEERDGTRAEVKQFGWCEDGPVAVLIGRGREAEETGRRQSVILHELGHVACRVSDKHWIGGPSDEWNSEMAAARKTFQWGAEELTRKYFPASDWLHHGGLPGAEVDVPLVGGEFARFKVAEDFKMIRLPPKS